MEKRSEKSGPIGSRRGSLREVAVRPRSTRWTSVHEKALKVSTVPIAPQRPREVVGFLSFLEQSVAMCVLTVEGGSLLETVSVRLEVKTLRVLNARQELSR